MDVRLLVDNRLCFGDGGGFRANAIEVKSGSDGGSMVFLDVRTGSSPTSPVPIGMSLSAKEALCLGEILVEAGAKHQDEGCNIDLEEDQKWGCE